MQAVSRISGTGNMLNFLLAVAVVAGQPLQPSPVTPPPQIEARCADGSVIRAVLTQEVIEVETKYGRLKIQAVDLRRIEVGIHLPAGTEARISTAVTRLGSTSHQEREAALEELVSLGEHAYPSVHAALKSADLEVRQRAEKIVTALKEKVPADRLRLDTRDRIETTEFTVAGRIAGPALKARTALFGDLDLRLCEVRTIRRADSPSGAVVVDAARHTLDAWLDTGINVDSAEPLRLSATGQVDVWPQTPGQYTCGAGGYRNAGMLPGTQLHSGTLVGRIGTTGRLFVVGEQFDKSPEQSGRLYLAITASPWNAASSGQYRVSFR